MDNIKIRTQLTASFLAVYGCAGDSNMIAAYVQVLQDIPIDVLSRAYDKVMLECDKRPVPAIVYKAAKNLVEQHNGTKMPTWAEVQTEIQKGLARVWYHGCLGEQVSDELYGKPCDPKWSRPEVKAIVDTYGFENLGRTNESDMPIVWAQLRKAYESIIQNKQEREVNAYVLGGGNELKKLVSNTAKQIKGV